MDRKRWMLGLGAGAVLGLVGWLYAVFTAPPGGLIVKTVPEGAALTLDGSGLEKSPVTLKNLRPGYHTLQATLENYEVLTKRIEVLSGKLLDLGTLEMVHSQGSLVLSTIPEGAEYHIKNEALSLERRGKTPDVLMGLPTGTYLVTFHREEEPDQRQEVQVFRNSQTPISWEFSVGTFVLHSTPPGVEAWENDKSLGTAPMTLQMPVGTHYLAFRYKNFPEQQHSVAIFKNEQSHMEVDFTEDSTSVSNAPRDNRFALIGPKGGKPPSKGLNFMNSIGMKLNWIRPMKGWAGVYEVTQGEYQKVMGSNPSEFNGTRYPVETVSWNDAMEFCKRLTALEKSSGTLPKGSCYTLPSDAEWSILVGNAKLEDAVTSLGETHGGHGHTELVGSRSPNKYGLYDTRGNVWEWCSDWYQNSMNDPVLVKQYKIDDGGGKKFKVLRGGGWFDDVLTFLSISYRISYSPETSFKGFGFRCVLVYEP